MDHQVRRFVGVVWVQRDHIVHLHDHDQGWKFNRLGYCCDLFLNFDNCGHFLFYELGRPCNNDGLLNHLGHNFLDNLWFGRRAASNREAAQHKGQD